MFAIFFLASFASASAQQVVYITGSSVSVGTSATTLVSGTITLTQVGAIDVAGDGTWTGGNDVATQVYVDGTAYGIVSQASTNSYGGGDNIYMSTANVVQITNLAVGQHTVAIYATGSNIGSSGLSGTASMLVTLENEPSAALASEVASITAAYQLADNQLQAEITALQTAMTTANSNISALQTQLAALQSQVNTNASNIATLQSQIAALQTTVSGLQTQVTALQNQPPVDLSGYQKKNAFLQYGVPGLMSVGAFGGAILFKGIDFGNGGEDKDVDMTVIKSSDDK